MSMAITVNYSGNFLKIADVAKIYKLEKELLKMPQADIKTEHIFYDGGYERKITIPPWTVLTGAVHKTPYTVRLEQGSIAVNTDGGVVLLHAPFELIAKEGVKRVGRVFESEVVWVDVYDNPDNITDIETLENMLYEGGSEILGENRIANRIKHDNLDYGLFVKQIGLSQSDMEKVVNTADLIPMPDGFDVEIKPSKLHGLGMFATRDFKAGEFICPGRIDGKRTPAGRFINHSATPNTTTIKKENGDLVAMSLEDISKGQEILINYRTSMLVNFGIAIEGALCQVG